MALALSVLASSPALVKGGALAADIAALIKKLDAGEWEIVSEAVLDRLPGLIDGKEEQAHFPQVMQSSQDVIAMAGALGNGEYEGLGAISANIIAGDLKKMVARRFREDSRLNRSIEIVEGNPDMARELTCAVLNADVWAARQAIKSSLQKYAETRGSELLQKGEKFWRGMCGELVPGNTTLSGLGVDPVDIYLQGNRDWSDFTGRTRLRFNNGMLDCLAVRYRKIREDGYSGNDARLEISNFDTGTGFGSSFNCRAEMDWLEGSAGEKSLTRRVVAFFTATGRSTAALIELGMSSGEIVDLIEIYGQDGGRNSHGRFSAWLQERMLKNIKTRAERLTDALALSQRRVAEDQTAEAMGLCGPSKRESAS